jgi:nucleotide-binding universal stress UspA family protein
MAALESSTHLKLDNILVATDLSSASEMALLHAISIARRHDAKLLVVHVSSSQSEGALMDAWRAVQTKILGHFIAGRLTDVRHELLVKSGDVWTVLAGLIAEYGIDIVVVGTRGRTGVWKLLLGSVAERIFRQSPCPVLIVGPSVSGLHPESSPQRILVPTGFAPQSLCAVGLRAVARPRTTVVCRAVTCRH